MHSANELIEKLELSPHPEGGFYREVYRSDELIPKDALPARFQGPRNVATAIYFLIPAEALSRLHRIQSDEIWYFHCGDPLEILIIDSQGHSQTKRVGLNFAEHQSPQVMVPKQSWFGARPLPGGHGYTLVSCSVSPGFDFADFELAEADTLKTSLPRWLPEWDRFL